ncbi:MAG: GNAT family N-acetyltransferase [Bacteroidia bacterium]
MLEITFNDFPILKTERLILRRIIAADAPVIFYMRSNDRVRQYLDSKRFESLEEAIDLIKRNDNLFDENDGVVWAISHKDDNAMIGTIGFWRIAKEHHRAEIGYMLHDDYRGKGIMIEAAKISLKYAFKELKLHSIEANTNPSNASSIKLLERLGFVREAYFKENFYFDGQFLDSAIYSLLNENKEGTIL